MRIGYFYTNFPSKRGIEDGKISFIGGQGVVAYNLAMEMGKRGNEIRVFSTSHDLHQRNEKLLHNTTVYYYGSIFSIYSARFSPGGFLKPLKQNLDIVHCHGPAPFMDFASILYKKVKKAPLVVTYHAEPSAYGYGSIIRRTGFQLYRRMVSILLSQADLIISPSEYFIEESRLKDYRSKVVVIPNGINLENFEIKESKEEARKRLNLPLDRRLLLFINALLPQKGPDILVKSMRKVIKRVPKAYLILVGKGEMRKELEDMAIREGIRGHVKFTGFIEEKEKPFYYKASDIFVLPSTRRHESFGIVNLEAMASGVPIVASRIGGVPDVVKHRENGLLVPPKDPDALAETLIYLLENEDLRKRMGEKGKAIVKSYTWEKVAERTEKVYKQLLGENASDI